MQFTANLNRRKHEQALVLALSKDNDNAQDRSGYHTALLQNLDKYIDAVIAMNHGTKLEELPQIVRMNLARNFQAIIYYHESMAEANRQVGDDAMSALHKIKVEIYKSIIPK